MKKMLLMLAYVLTISALATIVLEIKNRFYQPTKPPAVISVQQTQEPYVHKNLACTRIQKKNCLTRNKITV